MTLRTKYDKLVEINKQLMADIKVMSCCIGWEAIEMRLNWRKKFEAQGKELIDQVDRIIRKENVEEN